MAQSRNTTRGTTTKGKSARPQTTRSQSKSAQRNKSHSRPVSQSALKPHERHHFFGTLTLLLAMTALICTAARALPSDIQAWSFIPIVVSATPWFTLLALLALLLAMPLRRPLAALIAVAALGLNVYWQYPFFFPTNSLSQDAQNAVAAAEAHTADAYARVMTFNVYKGQADAQSIVNLVRDQRVEVLALQETTDDFVKQLNEAGIEHYLPYAHVSSSDGVYGNGLWSAAPLKDVVDDEVNSSASFMPSGTVDMGGNQIRFVSVHTTAPVTGYWGQWKRSLDELGLMRSHTDARYIFMGDFNATYDHTPFREFLGNRFVDAAHQSGHGFTFSWPTNRIYLPTFAGIDHVVLDTGMTAGQCQIAKIAGSDHAALLATISVG